MERFAIRKLFLKLTPLENHRGLSIIYVKHNSFNQTILGRDVELQSTHVVLLKSPHIVMQIITLSTLWALKSEPVDWYRKSTSDPLGHIFIWLSATARWEVTLLYKLCIHYIKIFYSWTIDAAKGFGRRIHKISPVFKCSNCFPQVQV